MTEVERKRMIYQRVLVNLDEEYMLAQEREAPEDVLQSIRERIDKRKAMLAQLS